MNTAARLIEIAMNTNDPRCIEALLEAASERQHEEDALASLANSLPTLKNNETDHFEDALASLADSLSMLTIRGTLIV